MAGSRETRGRQVIKRTARRLRCWWRGFHDYRIVQLDEVDGHLVGRLACQHCGREPAPENPA